MTTLHKQCIDCGTSYSVEFDTEDGNQQPIFCPFCSAESAELEEVNFDD